MYNQSAKITYVGHMKTAWLVICSCTQVAKECQKECRRAALQSQKMMKEAAIRARRLSKEMMVYWKRFEKVEKEHRKRAEKEAHEQRKMDIEMLEVCCIWLLNDAPFHPSPLEEILTPPPPSSKGGRPHWGGIWPNPPPQKTTHTHTQLREDNYRHTNLLHYLPQRQRPGTGDIATPPRLSVRPSRLVFAL